MVEGSRMERTLSGVESQLVLELEWDKKRIVTIDDVARILRCRRNEARVIAHRLEKKRWLERLRRNRYLFIPAERGEMGVPTMNPLLVGSLLVEPYYYSYSTSNAHYGFSTQMRPTLYLATTKTRRSFRWRNSQFRFVTLSRHKFFGFQEVEVLGVKVNMAEPEKTVVDSVDKLKYAGGVQEVLAVICNGLRKVDAERLVEYARRMRNRSLTQRMGYLIDVLLNEGVASFPEDERERLLPHVGKAAIYLDPAGEKSGRLDKAWRVIGNVPRSELLSEVQIR
jgi:predicted transcriptional regulator of viral defense system